MNRDLNKSYESKKLLQGGTGEKLFHIVLHNNFLEKTPVKSTENKVLKSFVTFANFIENFT
jgi:hypothetical protein